MTAPASPAPAAPSRTLENRVQIETPEQVVFSYTIAGVGTRGAAVILDYLLMTILMIALGSLLAVVSGVLGGVGTGIQQTSASWTMALLILGFFVLQWGYFVLFEALWDGQTPGKRRMGIRVVQDGGFSISFGASAVRNLARFVDMQPGTLYAVGILAAVFSRSGKRLGDMLAGTMVVRERVTTVLPPVAAANDEAVAPTSAQLTTEEYELLERFLQRRAALSSEARLALTDRFAGRFAAHIAGDEGGPQKALRRLYERERTARARGVAARGATGAARERHALVAQGAERWSAFAAALDDAQRRGLRHMTEHQVSDFVAQYREVATDLARLQTASHGRDSDALFYVSRLVAVGHNLLYRGGRLTRQVVWRFLGVSVPREIRRSGLAILAAALCLFGPIAVTWRAVVRDPSLEAALLPPGMIDRANEGVARLKKGDHTYVRIRDFERPMMASSIIANNVQVTIGVFVGGITAGVFTVLMLVLNGVSIGAVLGLYTNKGILVQILEFVTPHSVFELSAICIAGGAGLLVARALLLPGSLTRREALVVQGRRAIRLIAASTMLLVVAGSLEGLVSPRTDISEHVKLVIAGTCAVVLLLYAFVAGRWGEEAPAESFAYSDARALISR